MGFDEQELNTGIADLYDDDSASDYNEDSEEADIDNFLSMEAESIQPAPIPQDIGNISQVSGHVVPDFISNPPAPIPPSAAPIPCGAPAPQSLEEFVQSQGMQQQQQPQLQPQSVAPIPPHFPSPMSSNQ